MTMLEQLRTYIDMAVGFISDNWVIIAIFAGAVAAGFIFSWAFSGSRTIITRYIGYERKGSILSKSEQAMFQTILEVLENRHHLFPKVHLDAILGYKVNGKDALATFKSIDKKLVDFVVCSTADMRPLMGIEFDGAERSIEEEKSDEAMNLLFKEAGLPLLRFRTIDRAEISLRIREVLVGKPLL